MTQGAARSPVFGCDAVCGQAVGVCDQVGLGAQGGSFYQNDPTSFRQRQRKPNVILKTLLLACLLKGAGNNRADEFFGAVELSGGAAGGGEAGGDRECDP